MEEGAGFEPAGPEGPEVFKTSAIVRSAIPPLADISGPPLDHPGFIFGNGSCNVTVITTMNVAFV